MQKSKWKSHTSNIHILLSKGHSEKMLGLRKNKPYYSKHQVVLVNLCYLKLISKY